MAETYLELLIHRSERVGTKLQLNRLIGRLAEVAVGVLVGTINAHSNCNDKDGSH